MKTTIHEGIEKWGTISGPLVNKPNLGVFLAGWFIRDAGGEFPADLALGEFNNALFSGWHACDEHLKINIKCTS